MSDYETCPDCGHVSDRHATPHDCPGSSDDRIAALEERVAELEAIVARIPKCVLLEPHEVT